MSSRIVELLTCLCSSSLQLEQRATEKRLGFHQNPKDEIYDISDKSEMLKYKMMKYSHG